MSEVSLYTVNALLILDGEGGRVYAKYFQPPHSQLADNTKLYGNLKLQQSLEKLLKDKTFKTSNEILLFENQLVVYKTYSDVTVYLLAPLDENESLLSTVFNGFTEALEIVIGSSIDKRSLQENYDKLTLAADETIDDGVILEFDPAVIASRVTNAPLQDAPSLKNIDLSEKGFMNAFSFARAKLSETLQQGL